MVVSRMNPARCHADEIIDMVPRRSEAGWRTLFSMAVTIGKSVGGPVGGLATDKIGWRW